MPRINKSMGIGSAGFWNGFYRLTDAEKFAIVDYIDEQAVPPPRNSMLRCTRHKNFSILAAVRRARWRSATDACCSTRRAGGWHSTHLILATGLAVDWSQRPELASLKPHVVLWRDRFVPQGAAEYAQAEHPYVGPAFEFIAREGGAPWVNRIHCFNYAANLSHGPISGDIPAISIGAERVAQGIAGTLFAEDYAHTWRRLNGWSNPELRGDEFALEEDAGRFFAEQPAEHEDMSDVMDTLAGLPPGSPLAELRRQRPDVVSICKAATMPSSRPRMTAA